MSDMQTVIRRLIELGRTDLAEVAAKCEAELAAANARVYEEGVSRLIEAQKINNREIESLRAELESRTRAHHAAEQRELTALAELDEVRAENARQRAWIDGVMAQGAARVYGHDACGFARIKFPGDEPKLGTELITRPAPFEDK